MTSYEDDLQKNIESGNVPLNDDLDAKAYQQVFHALKKEPEFTLSSSFSDHVIEKIHTRQSSLVKDYLWLAAGLLVMVIVLMVAFYFAPFELTFGFLQAMSGYEGIFIFGALFIGLLNWMDKLLIKHKMHPE